MIRAHLLPILAVVGIGAGCSKSRTKPPQTEVFEPASFGTVETEPAPTDTESPQRPTTEIAPVATEPKRFWGLEDRATGPWPMTPPFTLSRAEKTIFVVAPVKSEDNPRRRVRLAWLGDMSRTKHLEISFPDAPRARQGL